MGGLHSSFNRAQFQVSFNCEVKRITSITSTYKTFSYQYFFPTFFFRQGQQEAEQGNLIAICLEHLNDPEAVLRQWLAIALGRVWDNYEPARWRGARDNAPEKLFELLKDEVPEVRAAAVFALGTFVNSCEERTEHANSLDHTIGNLKDKLNTRL